MKKIYVYTIGCPRRGLDAYKVADYFSKNGHELVNTPEKAGIIFLVTCALSKSAAKNSINKIKEFQNYEAELIVAGCLPEIEKEELSEMFDGKTLSTKNIDKIDDLFPENKVKFKDLNDANIIHKNTSPNTSLKKILVNMKNKNKWDIFYIFKKFIIKAIFGSYSYIYNGYICNKSGYFLRISWGCNNSCAYCAIKKAIGFHKSKSIEECVNEFKKGLDQGYSYFQIDADDTGAYGLDNGSSFPELLDEITKIPGDYKITINNFHPKWLIRYLPDLERIVKRKKISNFLIPLQSGNNRILKLMRRSADFEKVKNAIKTILKADPNLKIATHYIVGFPTETNEDFDKTLNGAKELGFSVGIFFKYSNRKGTVADKITPKLSESDLRKRMKKAKRFFQKEGYKTLYYPKKNAFYFDKNDFYKHSIDYLNNKKIA